MTKERDGNMKKENKKRELKESIKTILNVTILLLNYYVISTMLQAIKQFSELEGIYSFKYMLLIMLMLFSSSILLKRINFTRK